MVELLEDRSLLSVSVLADFSLLGKPAPGPQYQWDMTQISAPTAWSTTTANLDVIVADNDTGIDYTHPDLYLNVWLNQGEIPQSLRGSLVDTDGDGRITFYDLNAPANASFVTNSNGNTYIDAGDLLHDPRWADHVDDDGNSYTDDLIGWNFVNGSNDPYDDNGHGTHTAGTIGALHNGIGNGVDGVNVKVQIMALKSFDANGGGPDFDTALGRATEAIYYSARNGARVSNNSWGVYGYSLELPAMVNLKNAIAFTKDVLFVASAGNNGLNNDTSSFANYPSSFPLDNIVAVAATASNDQKPYWSNYGPTTVDLGAPGASVLSTVPGGGYAVYSGTSMASPHVAGTAALILSQYPALGVADVKLAIIKGVDVIRSMSDTASKGRLNVANALSKAKVTPAGTGGSTPADPGTSPPTGKGRGSIQTLSQIAVGENQIAAPTDRRLAFGDMPLAIGAPFAETFRFLASPNVANPAPTRPTIQTDSLVQSWIAPSAFMSGMDETTPARQDADQDFDLQLRGPDGDVRRAFPGQHALARNMAARHAVSADPFAPRLALNLPVNHEIPVWETPAPAPISEVESESDGFHLSTLGNAASKIFCLAGAALFFAYGAFFGPAREGEKEDERERRIAL